MHVDTQANTQDVKLNPISIVNRELHATLRRTHRSVVEREPGLGWRERKRGSEGKVSSDTVTVQESWRFSFQHPIDFLRSSL